MNTKKKVSVIGHGRVGRAMEEFFGRRYDITIYDPEKGHASREEHHGSSLAVVCVPTPMSAGGRCDTSLVEEAVAWSQAETILIRSTIPVGTTDRLKKETGKPIVFSPEYVGEASYWVPFRFMQHEIECPFYIFGGEPSDCERVIDIYAPISGPLKQYRVTSARVAEAVKAFENEFIAWKVMFANEMREACAAWNIPYWETRDLWMLDPRVGPMHTAAWRDARGFSGKCIPKDTLSMINSLEDAGYSKKVLRAIVTKNIEYRGSQDYPDDLQLGADLLPASRSIAAAYETSRIRHEESSGRRVPSPQPLAQARQECDS